MALIGRTGRLLAIVAALAAPANGQGYFATLGGPFSRAPVLNAPFSAEATTRIREAFSDGTERAHKVTARYYRDSQGAVRAEVDTPWGPYVVVASQGPESVEFYVLNPNKRTYRTAAYGTVAQLFNGEGGVALPVGKVCFEYPPLVADGASDAERLQAVNATVSPDLGIVIASHRFDQSQPVGSSVTRIGRSIDYELTHIRREEPSADLFQMPADYADHTRVQIGAGDDPMLTFTSWRGCGPP